jgi:hypothetical protein
VTAVAVTPRASQMRTLERDLLQRAAAIIESAQVAMSLQLAYRRATRAGGRLGNKAWRCCCAQGR